MALRIKIDCKFTYFEVDFVKHLWRFEMSQMFKKNPLQSKYVYYLTWKFSRENIGTTYNLPISLVFGSFVSTRCVILPRASDWIALIRSLSGTSVSVFNSWLQ